MNFSKMNHKELHEMGVNTSKDLRAIETKLIEILGNINLKKTYLKYACFDIYTYAEKYMQFKRRKVYDFLCLFESSQKIPELKQEIQKGEVGYSLLKTILPALEEKHRKIKSEINIKRKEESQNTKDDLVTLDPRLEIKSLIDKTKTHSKRELEKITRDIAPLKAAELPSPAPRYLGNNKVERIARLSTLQEVKLDKALNLIKQELKENISFERFIEIVSERVISNKLKAGNKKAVIFFEKDQNQNIGGKSKFISRTKSLGNLEVKIEKRDTGTRSSRYNRSIPLKIREEVFKRDGGRCICCKKESNTEFHHVKKIFEGGGHESTNIALLCRSCHTLVHFNYIKLKPICGTFKPEYINSNITSYADYVFERKRNEYLNSRVKRKNKNGENQILLF